MLSREDNALLTRVDRGTPMGDVMRRYWVPALLAREVPEPDGPPVRVKLLGEDLVAFRDTDGRVGLLDELCPHRRASLFFGRNEACGLRCVYHGWKYDVDGRCVDMMNDLLLDRQVQKTESFTGIEGINAQDGAIQESMGRVIDRSREHLGPADKAIIQARRLLLEAVKTVQAGGAPRGVRPTYYSIRAAEGVVPKDADWRAVLTPEMGATEILQTV